MNKFTDPPDNLTGLFSLIFWIALLSGFMALLFTILARVGG